MAFKLMKELTRSTEIKNRLDSEVLGFIESKACCDALNYVL